LKGEGAGRDALAIDIKALRAGRVGNPHSDGRVGNSHSQRGELQNDKCCFATDVLFCNSICAVLQLWAFPVFILFSRFDTFFSRFDTFFSRFDTKRVDL
jgi:hypothetical protein